MRYTDNHQHSYSHIWLSVLILLMVAGIITSCEQITGSKDKSDKGTKSNPDPESTSIKSFSASDELITAGETITLSWEVEGDAPITLTLEPAGMDVSGETEVDVSPVKDVMYRLIAENEGGSDEAELMVEVIAAGETAIEVEITGLPVGSKANVAVTDHHKFTQWVTENSALTGLQTGSFTVASGPVAVSGEVFVPGQGIQTIDVAKSSSNTTFVQVNYSMATGNLYSEQPDVEACNEGTFSAEGKERSLLYLNFIRTLTGLFPVDYDTGDDEIVQKASLMFAANSAIDHYPPDDWHCYSEDGADGAERSNIAYLVQNSPIDATPEDFILLWANDENVPSLGHRRWLLDPFLADVAIGLVEGTPLAGDFSNAVGSAIRVVGGDIANINSLPLPFVAYPRGDFPTDLLTNDWFLSFSVLADPRGRYQNQNQVDYSGADISVENENGSAMSVTEIMVDHTAYGLPNSIQWKVPGLQNNQQYTVTIGGVVVNGEVRNYSYVVNLL